MTAPSTPFALLRQVRDVMREPLSAQLRLDKLVFSISRTMDCEVCSIYMRRAGDMLELYASQGLNPGSIHLTRLRVGEGLVGEIAATEIPLNLSEARQHPSFVYREETGEEIYHSFAGVPVISAQHVVGVLVVQSRHEREFTEEEMEVLQTVAMVLAELHASGQLVSLRELSQGSGAGLVSEHLVGQSLSPGLARGAAVLHRPVVEIRQIVADDPSEEMKRLEEALQDLQTSVDKIIRESDLSEGTEQHDIMESYRMFAHDKGWMKQLTDAVHTGLTAEAAVKKVQDQMLARLRAVSSEYLRERMRDLEDLSQRLLKHLTQEHKAPQHLPNRFILVAHDIGPAEMLEYGRQRIRGLVLESGSVAAHIAIIARAMDIPVVGKLPDAMRHIEPGDTVIVDGDEGEVFIRPKEEIRRMVSDRLREKRARKKDYAAVRALPAETKDGVRISLNVNIGLQMETRHLSEEGVDGVGLYRTELPYMVSHSLPDVETQKEIYKEVLEAAGDKKVVFRTFDIGGDKQLPYFPIEGEANPALGWRASRIGLDRPIILRQQFRALIQASAGRPLHVMFPFITQVSEIDALKKLFDREMQRLKNEGYDMPSVVYTGIMVEIPAILYQLPAALKKVNFISIGSNDLLQYLFAVDRTNPRLTNRYDDLSPVVLHVVKDIVAAANEANVEVGFCGDMARKPLEAMALLGCGARNLSVPPAAIGPLKAMIRSLSLQEVTQLVNTHADLPEASIRHMLAQYAKEHGVVV